MKQRSFGRTGEMISPLGFGAMRLPMIKSKTGEVVDEDKAIAMMHRAFELGVNYIDTAFFYCNGDSERVVGKAVQQWIGSKILVSTKIPLGKVRQREDFRRLLDSQLEKMGLQGIDFYHFHGIGAKTLEEKILPLNLFEEMEKARDEDLIRFVSFSFHDDPAAMRTLVDTGNFDSVLCQYNMLDQSNTESIAYANEKGLGVVVMGPVGGGRLGHPSEALQAALPGVISTPTLALRFVLSNPNIHCALSGMSEMSHVEENCQTAARLELLGSTELAQVQKTIEDRKGLANLYCTACKYCMPCPKGVNIPMVFESMIYHQVYGMKELAINKYRDIGQKPWAEGNRADACENCGACEPKCPQKIPIRKQLAECDALLAPQL